MITGTQASCLHTGTQASCLHTKEQAGRLRSQTPALPQKDMDS